MRGIFTPFFKKHRKKLQYSLRFREYLLVLAKRKMHDRRGNCRQQANFGNKRMSATGGVGKERSVLRFGKGIVLIGMNLKKERGEKRTNGGKPRGGGKCYPRS